MILATMLEQDRGLPFSTVTHIDTTHVHLLCDCGSVYKLRKTNRAGDPTIYRCRDCKRIGRLQNNVGERHIFKRVRADARAGGRVFEIELDWFINKCHEPCHYCGRVDTNSSTVPSKTGVPLIKNFRYNGLDRIDNSIGYVPSNCVSCCFVCNRAKQSMPYSEFVRWIEDMIQYRSNHIRG